MGEQSRCSLERKTVIKRQRTEFIKLASLLILFSHPSVQATSFLLQWMFTYVKLWNAYMRKFSVRRWPVTCSNDIEIQWILWYWQSATTIIHKSRWAQSKRQLQQPDQMRSWSFCHTQRNTRNHARRENWDINWFEVQPSGEACKSQSHYVCTCVCVCVGGEDEHKI